MKQYDSIVIGSGVGMEVVVEAANNGDKVALVDKGPLGGTCPNLGCIPSKILIFAADRVAEIQESRKLGIEAEVKRIDFRALMNRMRRGIREREATVREGLQESNNLDFYEGEGHFVRDYVLEVNGEEIEGEKIFIACGARPGIPPIKGLNGVEYLTNETALRLKGCPESLIIVGGGYVGVEYAHFFAAMGAKVTLLEMADRLVAGEEPEISELLQTSLSRRMKVLTGVKVAEVKRRSGKVTVSLESRREGRKRSFTAEQIMIAAGRQSNADTLKPENTGVEVDEKGFIKVDEHFETTRKNIYVIGDANGKYMFTHAGDREAEIVAQNVFHGRSWTMNYNACPHAIYSFPQIASVGMTEQQARDAGYKLLVGRPGYMDVAKGEAMMESEGFAKVILDRDTADILGFHIIGPYAPMLIQEVVNAMAMGSGVDELNEGIHIHPAMSELIQIALTHLEEA